jgi:hypothetical protein
MMNDKSSCPNMLNRRKYTRDTVKKEAIEYLRTGHLPRRLQSVRTQGRFRQSWSGFSVRVNDDDDDADDDDEEEDDDEDDGTRYHLFHGNKRVVPNDQVQQIVSGAYAGSQTTGGRDRIYARLSKQYVGISRRAVMKVLKNQEVWQLLRRPHGPRAKRAVRQPILAKEPWVRLQIDLIDMSRFSGHNDANKWGLTVLDVFSKRAWAIPLRDKSGARVAEAFEEHVLVGQEWVPSIVQSDNGKEFRNHHFEELEARRGFKCRALQQDVEAADPVPLCFVGNQAVGRRAARPIDQLQQRCPLVHGLQSRRHCGRMEQST